MGDTEHTGHTARGNEAQRVGDRQNSKNYRHEHKSQKTTVITMKQEAGLT